MKATPSIRSHRAKAHGRQQGFVQVLLLVLVVFGITTFGVVQYQADIVERRIRAEKATGATLAAAKKGLLDYASIPPAPPFVFLGNVETRPAYNVFNLQDHTAFGTEDDILVPFRPGQLPCPDLAGDVLFSLYDTLLFMPIGTRVFADGNFDGVSDHSTGLCSAEVNLPIATDSNFGKYPWRDYSDFGSFIRGAGSGDLVDGNRDRLWYAVSHNLLDVKRPINPYKIESQQEGWLTVHITVHQPVGSTIEMSTTIEDVAAVVISPGTKAPAHIFDQSDRPDEDYWFTTRSTPGERADEDVADRFLEDDAHNEFSNIDGDLAFTHNAGEAPPWADRLEYIHKSEILEAFRYIDHDRHLDNLSDALGSYYDSNRHLPDPATFEGQNADFVTRRYGRTAKGVHDLLLDSTNNGLKRGDPEARLQGGRINYDFSPAWLDSTGNYNLDVLSTVRAEVNLPSDLVHSIYLPPWVHISPIGAANTQFGDLQVPPLSEFLHAAGTGGGVEQPPNVSGWEAVVPANTLMQLATPAHVLQERDLIRQISRGGIAVNTISVEVTTAINGPYVTFGSDDHNVLFADLRPGSLENLSRLGYSARLPRGTFIKTTAAITIIGTSRQLTVAGGVSIAAHNQAFLVKPDPDIEFSAGVKRDLDPMSLDDPLAIPAMTPLAPGNQGLLPVPFFNVQFPEPDHVLNSELFGQGLNANAETVNQVFREILGIQGFKDSSQLPGFAAADLVVSRPAVGTIEDLPIGINQVALISDPSGGYGSFPALVTMHPLFDRTIDNSNRLTATENVLRTFTTPGGRLSITNDEIASVIRPYPISAGDNAIVPALITLEGYVTVPTGSKFFYPGGTRVPIGRNRFSHGAPGRIFGYYDSSDDLVPTSAMIGHNVGPEPGRLAVAHLAPGAVISNVTITAGQIMPDSSTVTAATVISRLTLVNGGQLTYTQLLHYNDGDFSMLPITWEQAAFRIEAMGMGLVENERLEFSPGADSLAQQLVAYMSSSATSLSISATTSLGSNSFNSIHPSDLYDGFHLYPYHTKYVPMSRRLGPLASVNVSMSVTINAAASISITAHFRTPVVSGDTDFIHNVLGRSDVTYYTIGPSDSTITLSPADNRGALKDVTTSPAFSLVDELGVGVELDTRDDSAQSYDAATVTIVPTTPGITAMEIDLAQGVSLQANPGQYHIFTTIQTVPIDVTATNLTVDIDYELPEARLALNQFGPWENSTPLSAPFAPGGIQSHATITTADLISVLRSGTDNINPRASEIALRFDPSATLTTFSGDAFLEEGSAGPYYSDSLRIGTDLQDSNRIVFNVQNDALLATIFYSGDPAAEGIQVLKGNIIEYGMLERPQLQLTSSFSALEYSNVGDFAATEGYFANDFVPGGRVHGGIGFYPVGFGSGLRFARDQTSFANPGTITVAVVDTTNLASDISIDVYHDGTATLAITNFNLMDAITVANPRLLLPAGNDLSAGSYATLTAVFGTAPTQTTVIAGAYQLDHDIALVGDSLEWGTTTVTSPVIKLTLDTHALNILKGDLGLDMISFNFVASANGAVVSSTTVSIGNVVDGQVFRLRLLQREPFVRFEGNLAGLALPVSGVEFIPMLDLSWSGVKDDWVEFNMLPDDMVFAQNNPLLYAVAEDCRSHLIGLTDDCASEEGQGLNAYVFPGSDVRLPSDTVAPAGLVIHGHQGAWQTPSRIRLSNLSSTATITVAGIQLLPDGSFQVLENHPSIANALQVDTGFSLSSLGAVGETIIISPEPRGLEFLYSEIVSDFVVLPDKSAINPAEFGHLEPVTVILGGYTLDNEHVASFRLTLDSTGELFLSAGSTIGISEADGTAVSLHLGLGSEYVDAGGATVNLDETRNLSFFSDITLTVQSDSVRTGLGLQLPEPLPAGSEITLSPASSPVDLIPEGAQLIEIVTIAAGSEVTVNEPGYAWQGLITPASPGQQYRMDIHVLDENVNNGVGFDELDMALRDYNYDVAGLTLGDQLIGRITPTTTYERDGLNMGMPQHKTLRDDWLLEYDTFTYDTAVDGTLSNKGFIASLITGTITGGVTTTLVCTGCLVTIDISGQATVTMASATATTYQYAPTLTISPTVTDQTIWMGIRNFDPTQGGTLTVTAIVDYVPTFVLNGFDPASLNVTSGMVTISTSYSNFHDVIFPFPGDVGYSTGDFITLSYTTFGGLDDRVYVDSGSTDNTIAFTAGSSNAPGEPDDPPSTPTNHSADATVVINNPPDGEGLGAFPLTTGFTLERFGNQGLTISIGTPFNLHSPVALYQTPAASNWPLTVASAPPGTSWQDLEAGSGLGVNTNASQLFLDRPLFDYAEQEFQLSDVNNDPPLFNESYLSFSGAPGRLALQVPIPALTIGAEEFPAGSLIYPETGIAVRAQYFSDSVEVVITLGTNGAVANVVAGGGAGRPALVTNDLANNVADISLGWDPVTNFFERGFALITTRLAGGRVATLTTTATHHLIDGGGVATTLDNPPDHRTTVAFRQPFRLLDVQVNAFDSSFPQASDIDTRAMDAIITRPSRVPADPFFDTSPNLAANSRYTFAPALHRISIPSGTVITVFPYSSTDPGQREFRFSTAAMLDSHTPDGTSTVDAMKRESRNLVGSAVERIIESRIDTTNTTLVYGTSHPPGFNKDITAIGNDIYQNIWIRTGDDMTIQVAGVDHFLPANSVINPFLGTYIPPLIGQEPGVEDMVRINVRTPVKLTNPIELTRGSMMLERGVTLGVARRSPLRFSNIKAMLGYSPRPATDGSVLCSEYQIRAITQERESLTEFVYGFTGAATSETGTGPIDEESTQVGDAHPCMLMDMTENNNLDDWFIIGLLGFTSADAPDEYFSGENDQFRMIGGRMVP